MALKLRLPRPFANLLADSPDGREEMLAGPIRGELLGADHLAGRARTQARNQRLVEGEGRRRTPLLARLQSTRRILTDAHERLGTAAAADIDVGPAGDWLLDNFHVVEEHIREVRESLPRGYYRELPELTNGTLAGYPRVYDVAITLISHTEGRVDLDNVHLFVGAFQEEAALRIGELWAIPAMLRLGLIENVRRMALRTVQRLDEVEAADRWATSILAASEAGNVGTALAGLIADTPTLSPIFVSRFLTQLRMARESFAPLGWLEAWLADEGVSAEEAASRSTQRLAITQLIMANSITSLRAIARMDWRRFVERQSVMERLLRDDPSGYYGRMTFSTRDHYRHVVERIAKRTDQSEEEVASAALELARLADQDGTRDPVRSHVGNYLIGDGLPELEYATAYRAGFGESFHRWVLRHPNVVFVGGVLAGTGIAMAVLFRLAGADARAAWLAVVLVALIPASDVAVSVMNQLVAAFLPPRVLPKLDLSEGGVPPEFRTAVVIPTLFANVDAVREALENLEVQFLANRETHLHFAVLSDFTDAPTETQPTDAAIVDSAVTGIRALNARYAGGAQVAFYLFHRPRRWNPQEGVWMGWERKRGKLAEFNRFLRGGASDAFMTVVGEAETLQDVRYVITLDSDTVLPPDSAPLLVGALAHPLNRAVFDPDHGRVVRGYGILQPRVGVSLPSAHRSRFASIYSGHPGVDPYTTAVSDVYQDLYGEGSFTGKGIYDVDAFEEATHGRFPENTLLSHDLIEGSYARAGLATDINVYDDYPAHYLTYSRRKHRWVRGDWQLLKWLTPRVPGPDGPEPNRLSMLSRWKIVDNLRRSTVEIALVVFLIAGWLLLPGSPLRWTLLGLGAIASPWIVSLLLAILRPPFDKSWRAYYAAVGHDAVTSAEQVGLAVTFLAHQAWTSADAIVRTLWRLFVSRRHLLEWQTFSHTQRAMAGSGPLVWRVMGPTVALAGGVGLLVIVKAIAAPGGIIALVAGLPLLGLWIAAPMVADAVSSPKIRRERRLPAASRIEAMRYALLHWRFFDRFVTEGTNWLAPDNFQEDPAPVVAMRTSPTNIGLQLLATASAYDLGFITLDDMTRRLELALRSLERMRRFRGHFYNWYDLRDLRVLEPGYVSTVDSGNLAGHLIALRQACVAAPDAPIFGPASWRGLETALALAAERLRAPGSTEAPYHPAVSPALRTARENLNWARSAMNLGMHSPDLATTLGEIGAPLRTASEALAAVRAHEGVAPAAEWLEWAASWVVAHREQLGTLRATGVRGREGEVVPVFPTLRELAATSTPASELVSRLDAIAGRADDFSMEMDFRFLFDERRKLFSIGYQQTAHTLDNSYYDLLASEARLASFLAVAKNDVPVDHWFHLGRTLTHTAGATALVSWSGSMFEYLMPALVMQSFPSTVLDQTYQGAVRRQITYGAEHGVPWGVSESAYNLRDRHLTYQYRAFGVPDLALKRGLGRDLVVAPYASALAMLVDAEKGLANLRILETKGALGPYGFRDALDYTRPEPGNRYALVRTYMAHHVGMGFVALTNVLSANIWVRRFHADPVVRAAELLLHERIPRRLVLQEAQEFRPEEALPDPDLERPAVRQVEIADSPQPIVALLGRLPYTIMISGSGSGYSRYEDLAVTRWRADATADNTGQFCYVKDVADDHLWSAAHQPVCAKGEWYHAFLATDRVTFQRADHGIETRTEIAVVPEDSAEVRRVTVTNTGGTTRELELTSYGEIVLTKPEADRAHPAFANLFVETEWHQWCTAITATRRPRSAIERSLWCAHVVDRGGKERSGPVTFETDRSRFIGRGRSTRDPIALEGQNTLSGTTGAVLDPIFALRTRVRLDPGQSASVAFTTLVATSRERAFELADRYHDPHAAQRALDLAWTSTQVELRELRIAPADAAIYQDLAGHLLYSNAALRAPQAELMRNRGGQPLLWASGISGDLPILLATIDELEGLPTLRHVFAAHHYWRRRGMMVDLVILNTHPSTYLAELQDRITETMFASADSSVIDRPGGVFIRRRDQLGPDDLLMLRATARVHLPCDGRSLGRIVDAVMTPAERVLDESDVPPSRPRSTERQTPLSSEAVRRGSTRAASPATSVASGSAAGRPTTGAATDAAGRASAGALYDNGYGALTAEGDYEIRVRGDHVPPAPWANVVANPRGGFLVTERGAGFTWAENSQFFRLTPWHNDPVSDPASDVLYLRDDDTGDLWSATPAPVRNDALYFVRHGAGSSTFESERDGIATHLTLGIPENDPVKISVLRVANRGRKPRRLTVTAYAEWTLGGVREHTQHQVQTRFDPSQQAMLARNFFEPQFAGEVAFHAMSEPLTGHTGDRREFLGRNGTASAPAALRQRASFTETTGAGIDPCSALQCAITLKPGETRTIVVLLGSATGDEAVVQSLERYREPERARTAIERTLDGWRHRLSVITVRTPEPSFDVMVNRWTLYQALACRMWGRSALYQSSGAYGFRDQLQDSMAFVYAEPDVAREHIVRASGRQFVEGDVQHWWHPPLGRGVRTKFSDDLAWLPFVVDHYVRVTGDSSVLDESAPYLTMRLLREDEHELYDLPQDSGERGTVYDHCMRALHRACTVGAHGLPLIGIGDWNDGMNRVGVHGQGETVWLAWFLITTLRSFAEHAEVRGDGAVAARLRGQADSYAAAIEEHAWDGEWYRRAYFDSGAVLGSAANDECRIDAIAQSWSVISGAGRPDRQEQAMASFEKHLVRDDARLMMLLTPAFDKTPHDPGYIKGYLPGVRENGAQYTHAALWSVLATALRGDGDRAFELYQMINPLTHAGTREAVDVYKVEPYVVAADVYTATGHLGRGGWTWYTGSASWMYRVGLEAILGFRKRGSELFIEPQIPESWKEYGIEYRFGGSVYSITVQNSPDAESRPLEIRLDGRVLAGAGIPLVDDGVRHEVVVRLAV